jgi:flagellum-specific peptidoglycan hydrolase FlgJ
VILKAFYLLLFIVPFMDEQELAERAYLDTHAELAIREMQNYGIPASITLAQALVESDAGRSVLATRANNHFGIKCKSWWNGGQYFYADDDRNASGQLMESCFRIYDSVSHSFEDHSRFLKGSSRYALLFDYEITDYHNWANGLQACGYATNTKYSKRLIQIIEKYRLYELDQKS